MNNKEILDEVYKDFFGSLSNKDTEEDIAKAVINIDDLLIDNESKELLKKITTYMDNYNDSKRYINFNLLIKADNEETINKIINIINNKNNYIKNSKVSKISFNEIEDLSKINEYYNNGIVLYTNLDKLESTKINKFITLLKEKTTEKVINILSGKKEIIDEFLKNDNDLEKTYFPYHINGINPENIEIFNEIIQNIDNLSEENQTKLLDYVTLSFKNNSLDYPTYRDNLIDYISFNNAVPSIINNKTNEEILEELNDLVGLKLVKDTINDLINLISLKSKTNNELKINDINLHMVFLGNPGTGKTTVARIIAGILYNLNYIKENKLVEVTSKDLVAEYVGQTGPKTMNVINKAMGGVLFIDEAYSLASGNDNSFNKEAIAMLIKAMEDYRDNLVVIFAGYTREMQDFLDSNSGIRSRIGYTFEFADYTEEELIDIFSKFVKKAGFDITNEAIKKVKETIKEHLNDKNFGNARFVRNLFEKIVIKHATNTKNIKNKKDLKTIKEEDI